MFTGIIQDMGIITSLLRESEQTHITCATTLDMSRWKLGDSIAIHGCCLTVTHFNTDNFSVTLSPETLNMTIFSDALEGQRVNLEPALRMGDAMGGHIVSGHVDGMGMVETRKDMGEHRVLCFSVPQSLAAYIVTKGSITVNGVSLTVNEVNKEQFTVNLIPHTLAHTTLGDLKAGDQVNLETDMLGRYVERLLEYKDTLK